MQDSIKSTHRKGKWGQSEHDSSKRAVEPYSHDMVNRCIVDPTHSAGAKPQREGGAIKTISTASTATYGLTCVPSWHSPRRNLPLRTNHALSISPLPGRSRDTRPPGRISITHARRNRFTTLPNRSNASEQVRSKRATTNPVSGVARKKRAGSSIHQHSPKRAIRLGNLPALPNLTISLSFPKSRQKTTVRSSAPRRAAKCRAGNLPFPLHRYSLPVGTCSASTVAFYLVFDSCE